MFCNPYYAVLAHGLHLGFRMQVRGKLVEHLIHASRLLRLLKESIQLEREELGHLHDTDAILRGSHVCHDMVAATLRCSGRATSLHQQLLQV